MNRLALAALPLILVAPNLSAQEGPPQPAPQLEKLAVLLGSWEGSGTVQHGPGGPTDNWTAKSSSKWTLNGHFVREDIRIDIEGAPGALSVVALYGWDRENERYVKIEAGNLGQVALTEIHWGAGGEMVTAGVHVMDGSPVVEQWVHRFEGDRCEFTCHEAIGGSEFFTHVSGTMKRVSDEPTEVGLVDAAFMPELVAPAAPHMKRMEGSAGDYAMKGWFQMEAGAPKIEFSGTEHLRSAFGGTVLAFESKGDPMPGIGTYEALGWMGWDAHRRCYKMIFANSMGEIGEQQGRYSGDHKMVVTGAFVQGGRLTAMRGVIELDEHGAFKHYVGHSLIDTHEPLRAFEATYEKL